MADTDPDYEVKSTAAVGFGGRHTLMMRALAVAVTRRAQTFSAGTSNIRVSSVTVPTITAVLSACKVCKVEKAELRSHGVPKTECTNITFHRCYVNHPLESVPCHP